MIYARYLIPCALILLAGCGNDTAQDDDDIGDDDSMGDDDSVSSPMISGCEEFQVESHYCIVVVYAYDRWSIGVVGLDSTELCLSSEIDGDESGILFDSTGLIDNFLFTCADDFDDDPCGRLVRIDLANGSTQYADIKCTSVASYGEELLVLDRCAQDPIDRITHYTSFDAAMALQGEMIINADMHAEVIGVVEDRLYTAWHSTNSLSMYQLPSLVNLGNIGLEGYDTWVKGISPLGDREIVLNAYFPEERFVVFGSASGEFLYDIPLRLDDEIVLIRGLSCL